MIPVLRFVARFQSPATAKRFWAKVDHAGPLPAIASHLGRCWIWTGARNERGYGRFGVCDGTIVYAHRWVYRRTVGPIPVGRELDHLCGNTSCVRPAHLEAVTHVENCWRSYVQRTEQAAA